MFHGLCHATSPSGERVPELLLSCRYFQGGFFDQHAKIAAVLIEAANADLEISFELVFVEVFRENAEFAEYIGNRVRPIVAHGADQLAIAESVIAGEVNPSDLDLRAFFQLENQNHGMLLAMRSICGVTLANGAHVHRAVPLRRCPPS